ncbi:hypothetical protein [Bosea sp. FBZP-16]|uniref:hypothetical protein n=1 Tax=Bosea sp. FBZP-16 TaxID=2065382 RepID=UPI001319C4E5|nr:hypothetical protein [Bosea sp. FBZP-16]
MRPTISSALCGAIFGAALQFTVTAVEITRPVDLPSLIGMSGGEANSLSTKNAYLNRPREFLVFEPADIELFVVEPPGADSEKAASATG